MKNAMSWTRRALLVAVLTTGWPPTGSLAGAPGNQRNAAAVRERQYASPPAASDDIDELIKKLGGKSLPGPEPAGPGTKAGRDAEDDPPPKEAADRAPESRPGSRKPDDRTAAAKASLPKHFEQLDLSDGQKEAVLKVAARFDARIAELKRKIDDARHLPVGGTAIVVAAANAIKKLNRQRQQELENVLNDEQRAKLRRLRTDNAPPNPNPRGE
jgi:hypothetical protein